MKRRWSSPLIPKYSFKIRDLTPQAHCPPRWKSFQRSLWLKRPDQTLGSKARMKSSVPTLESNVRIKRSDQADQSAFRLEDFQVEGSEGLKLEEPQIEAQIGRLLNQQISADELWRLDRVYQLIWSDERLLKGNQMMSRWWAEPNINWPVDMISAITPISYRLRLASQWLLLTSSYIEHID